MDATRKIVSARSIDSVEVSSLKKCGSDNKGEIFANSEYY